MEGAQTNTIFVCLPGLAWLGQDGWTSWCNGWYWNFFLTLWREAFETGGCGVSLAPGSFLLGSCYLLLSDLHCYTTPFLVVTLADKLCVCVCVCGLMALQPHRIFVALLFQISVFLDKTIKWPSDPGILYILPAVKSMTRQTFLFGGSVIFLYSFQGNINLFKNLYDYICSCAGWSVCVFEGKVRPWPSTPKYFQDWYL